MDMYRYVVANIIPLVQLYAYIGRALEGANGAGTWFGWSEGA